MSSVASSRRSSGSGGKAQALRRQSTGAVEDGSPKDLMNLNLEHNEAIRDAMARVHAHPVFQGIMELDPLPIKVGAESGVEEPFDLEKYKIAISSEKKMYKCSGNLFWLSMFYTPTPGVPTRGSSVLDLAMHNFQQPAHFPATVTARVSAC
jgi:hypothetical protein